MAAIGSMVSFPGNEIICAYSSVGQCLNPSSNRNL